ncbi:MAG: HAMP domain-containing protein [Desulfobacteraceae bacterium]|nr:HAMP domain-containing protein [Desulfobacteraceae bacterium]
MWLTCKSDSFFNIFNIDFDADSVKQAFWLVSRTVIGLILILMVLIFYITTGFSWMLTTPITELTKGAKAVAGGDYDYRVPIFQPDELGEFTDQFNEMTKGQKERLNLMETLEKFLSKELAEIAAKEGLKLGGESLNCTVMFTDFAGFSTITQHLNAGGVVEALNVYFDAMIPIIKKYGGFPDKYIGDAIVAIFGAPVRLQDHAERAVLASIEMQKKNAGINNKRRAEGKPYFEMRIGLNSGEVICRCYRLRHENWNIPPSERPPTWRTAWNQPVKSVIS